MDHLRQIEDDLRNLGVETKRYPEIKDATERALATLKTIRELYISDIRKNTEMNPSLSQSNDISAPYILLCNYADATPKLINMALSGIQMLLNYEVVPPSDVKNILRVLAIQASAPRTEFQLKILQILLLMANSLSTSASKAQYLSEATVSSFISQCLKMSRDSRSSVSVALTALSATRQIVTLVMDASASSITSSTSGNNSSSSTSDGGYSSESTLSALRLIRDLTLFSRGLPGEWIKGVAAPQSFALELLHDLMADWATLFRTAPPFEALLFDCVCPALKSMLRNLQEDYLSGAAKSGMVAAAALTSRVLRVARLLLLEYASLSPQMLGEVDLLVTLMLHSMQPFRGDTDNGGAGEIASVGSAPTGIRNQLVGLGMSFGMGFGLGSAPSSSSNKRPGDDSNATLHSPAIQGGFLTLGKVGGTSEPAGNGHGKIPAHPVACCLEALLSFFLSIVERTAEEGLDGEIEEGAWTSFVSSAMINVLMSVSGVICGGLAVDSSLLDFKRHPTKGVVGDRLVFLVEGYLSGSEGEGTVDLKSVLRALHEYPLAAPAPLSSSEVLFLAFSLTQVISRIMLKNSAAHCALSHNPSDEDAVSANRSGYRGSGNINLSRSSSSNGHSPACEKVQLFVSSSSLSLMAPSCSASMQSAMARVCESVYEPVEDCCAAILSALSLLSPSFVEESVSLPPAMTPSTAQSETSKSNTYTGQHSRCSWLVSKRAIGVLTEIAMSAGFLGQSKACSSTLAILCRNTAYRWDIQGHPQQHPKQQRMQQGDEYSLRSQVVWSRSNWIASVRLLQLVHLLADFIPDWDLVVHALDHLTCIALTPTDTAVFSKLPLNSKTDRTQSATPLEEPVQELDIPSPVDAETILAAIGRFKYYSRLMSDEALVRLTTSLVTLSLNSYGTSVTHSPHTRAPLLPTLSEGSSDANERSGSNSNTNITIATAGASASSASNSGFNNSMTGKGKNPLLNRSQSLPYLQESISQGAVVNFALQTVIEVTKLNSFRASCIWQMVASHLRIIASMKNSGTRYFAVAATVDIVKCTLKKCNRPLGAGHSTAHIGREVSPCTDESSSRLALLSDKHVFEKILPSSGDVLCPPYMQDSVDNTFQLEMARDMASVESLLSAHDVLHALNTLSAVRYDDVRSDIIVGLLELLQEVGGEAALTARTTTGEPSGWTAVLNLLCLVPASMTAVGSGTSMQKVGSRDQLTSQLSYEMKDESDTAESDDDDEDFPRQNEPEWPRASLTTAFKVVKLIADEFLESMGLQVISEVILCLSIFAAQTADVNISLTSVEMLWKVSDVAMSPPIIPQALSSSRPKPTASALTPTPAGCSAVGFEIFQMMLGCLEDLSLDPRPEVRKSAVNTLFSSLTAHSAASLLSVAQLRTLFEKSVFPLFQVQLKSERCRKAFGTSKDEEASAPELKKGVKMNIHHSRDTANKQWSETRTLSLRGLSRLLRTVTRGLLHESDSWFKREVWHKALALSHVSIETVDDSGPETSNTEISLAAVDLLFAMLRTVSTPTASTPALPSKPLEKSVTVGKSADNAVLADEMVAERESSRDDLWQNTWSALKEAVEVRSLKSELALHMCQSLSALYAASSDAEFRYSANIQTLLEMVVVLSRPRIPDLAVDGTNPQLFGMTEKDKRKCSTADIQLQRAVTSLLRSIKAVDCLAFISLVSCLSELCFSFQTVLLAPPQDLGSPILLGPCDPKLRVASSQYILEILQASLDDREGVKVNTHSNGDAGRDGDALGAVPVPLISRGSALSTLDVVLKRFHYDVCASPMAARVAISERDRKGDSGITRSRAVTSASDGSSSSGSAWFLSSIGRMLSPSDISSPLHPPVPASSSSSSSSPKRRPSSSTLLHKFTHARYNPENFPAADSSSSSRYRTLFDLSFEMDLLVRTIEVCFKIANIDSAAVHQPQSLSQSPNYTSNSISAQRQHSQSAMSVNVRTPSVMPSLSMWSTLLSVVACSLSPWTEAELSLSPAPTPHKPSVLFDHGLAAVPYPVTNLLTVLLSTHIESRSRSTSVAGGKNNDIIEKDMKRDSITNNALAGKLPWRLPLLEVCGASGILLVHSLLRDGGSVSSQGPGSHTVNLMAALSGLWDAMINIVKCETADPTHRKKSLSCCLEILQSFLEGIRVEVGLGAAAQLSPQLCAICASFIDDFSAMDCPSSVQLAAVTSAAPKSLSSSKPSSRMSRPEERDAAVKQWLRNCGTETVEHSLSIAMATSATFRGGGGAAEVAKGSNSFAFTSRDTGSIEDKIAETRARGHLLLALPCIVSLVCLTQNDSNTVVQVRSVEGVEDDRSDTGSSTAECIRSLRGAACRAVSRIDMGALMDSYTGLEERAKHMQAENIRLQAEIDNMTSSAASLPF